MSDIHLEPQISQKKDTVAPPVSLFDVIDKPFTPSPSKPAAQKASFRETEAAKRQRDILGLMNGDLILCPSFSQRYELQELLGDGAFGFVITAIRTSDRKHVTWIKLGGGQVYSQEQNPQG